MICKPLVVIQAVGGPRPRLQGAAGPSAGPTSAEVAATQPTDEALAAPVVVLPAARPLPLPLGRSQLTSMTKSWVRPC